MSPRNTVQLLLALIWTLSIHRKFASAQSHLTLSRDLCSEVGATNCELEANRTESITCSLSVCDQLTEDLSQSHHSIEFHIIRRGRDSIPVQEESFNYYLGAINMSAVIRHEDTCHRTLSFNTTEEMDMRTFQCRWRGPNSETLFSNAIILAITQVAAVSPDPTPPMPTPTACDLSTVTVTRSVALPSCTTVDDDVLQTPDPTTIVISLPSTAQMLRPSNLLLLVLLLSLCFVVVHV